MIRLLSGVVRFPVLVLLMATFAFAQMGELRGKAVYKANGAPIHNATILIVQLGRSTTTDLEGNYAFRNLPPGRYTVVAHMHPLSDQRKTLQIEAQEPATLDFELALAPIHDEITVTATGREEIALESFQTVGTVQALELAKRSSASLGEALENETGVAKRSFGPGTSRPVVRGFDGDRVLILQDGAPTGTLSSQSGDHGEPIDVSSLDRVEVVRGPAALMYGTNAIGGVVNVITQHHQQHEHAHPGIRGFASASGGSGNAQGGGNAGFDFGVGQWTISGAGGGLRTGDYSTPLGVVENTHTRLAHSSGGLARHTARGFFHLNYGVYDGRYGIPSIPELEHDHGEDADADHDYYAEDGHGHEEGPIDLKWRRHNIRFGAGLRELGQTIDAFKLHLNYSDWSHRELVFEDPHTRFSNNQLSYRGVFDQRRTGLLSGSFGFSGMVRKYNVTGAEALTPPVGQTSFGIFAVEELGFERIRLQFGGRLETNRYNPDGLQSRNFTGLSGSAGLNTRLWDGGALVASVSNSFRAPALEELYNTGPHPGNLAYEVGDSLLRRERSQGFDVSLRHTGGRMRGELNFFRYAMSDYVFLEHTPEIEDGLFVAFYRQADARYRGAEARLDLEAHPNLWLNFGVDSVQAELRNPSIPLPRIPPVRGRVGFEARYKGLSLRPELLVAGAQESLYTGETRTAGYGLVNLTGTYTVVRAHALHAFSVGVHNAGDRLYRNHVSLIKNFAPEMSRGVRFTYTVRFF